MIDHTLESLIINKKYFILKPLIFNYYTNYKLKEGVLL